MKKKNNGKQREVFIVAPTPATVHVAIDGLPDRRERSFP